MKRNGILICVIVLLSSIMGCGSVGMDSSEPKNEPIVTISIMDDLVGMSRVEDGWLGDIVIDALGIQLELVLATNSNKADIIMSSTEGKFTDYYLEKDMILPWNTEWLEEYGSNIVTYRQEQLQHVTEISGNTLCGFSGTGKSQYVYAISKDCEHPEVAMQFLNWLTDPDIMLTIYYGPQGLCWDIDEEGYYYLTEFGIQCQEDNYTEMPEGYEGTFVDGNIGIVARMWNIDDVNPESKHGETFNWINWKLMKE